MKAGWRWNFLCHSAAGEADRSRHCRRLNLPETSSHTGPGTAFFFFFLRRNPGAGSFPDLTRHLSPMTNCWPTRAQASSGGGRGAPLERGPLERSPSQTNTSLHQGFPQTSAHFSVPVPSPSQTRINTYTYDRERRENVRATEYSKKEKRFYHL